MNGFSWRAVASVGFSGNGSVTGGGGMSQGAFTQSARSVDPVTSVVAFHLEWAG